MIYIPEELYEKVEAEYERLLNLFPHASKKFLMDLTAETIFKIWEENEKQK